MSIYNFEFINVYLYIVQMLVKLLFYQVKVTIFNLYERYHTIFNYIVPDIYLENKMYAILKSLKDRPA
jgi:hypothetical protein